MCRPMLYPCLAGIGGVIVIVAGAVICATGYTDPGSKENALSSNNTKFNDTGVTYEDNSESGLSIMSYGGAVVMGFGSFVVIVSTVVFFEQREQSIKAKINAEEKAKKKRGYKAKPKKRGAMERLINGIIQCTNECSQPIKLKEVEPEPEKDLGLVFITQPVSQKSPVTSPNGSVSSMKKVLDELPQFETIEFLYRDENEQFDRDSQPGSLADRVEPFTEAESHSLDSEASFTKMDDLYDKEDEEEEDIGDSISIRASRNEETNREEAKEEEMNDEQEKEEEDITESDSEQHDSDDACSKGHTDMKDNEQTTLDNANGNVVNADENDGHKQNGIIIVQEKSSADHNGNQTNRDSNETHVHRPTVPPRRLPLITDHVERLTCGIARTNAQAMDRVRKPPPVPDILDM